MPTALITGASAGLGQAFAKQLAASGHDLLLVARRESRLAELAEVLRAKHENLQIECCAADLSESESVQQLIQHVGTRNMTIDVLVNNAGAGGPVLLDGAQPWSVHAQYLQLMMLSVTELCHAFVPGMVTRGSGWVINVASVSGRIASPGDGHYGASKAYLIAMSEDLALTVRKSGVHVCVLCPGFTHTEFHEVTPELSEMKASVPKWLWYSADQVVADGLTAVALGKRICVSGRLYRWLDPWLQFTPTRKLVQHFM